MEDHEGHEDWHYGGYPPELFSVYVVADGETEDCIPGGEYMDHRAMPVGELIVLNMLANEIMTMEFSGPITADDVKNVLENRISYIKSVVDDIDLSDLEGMQ